MNVEEYFRKKQKGIEDARTEAAIQRTILIVIAVLVFSILWAYVWVVYLLIKSLLYGKSKLARILSAFGLVGIAVGTILLVRYKLMDDYTSEPPRAVSHRSSDSANRDGTKVHQSVYESTDSKTKETETRLARTETHVPSPTISEPNEKDSSPNRPEEVTDSRSQPEVRQAAERKAEDAEIRLTRTETSVPSPTIHTPNEKESSPNQSNESADPQPQAVAQPNPHFEAAKKHDWQRLCQKEWSRSFLEIQGAFSVFGGFKLAQAPIGGIEFDSEDIQKDVPLQKKYRYFKTADLEFFNGALVGFTLKAHFAKNYSKASVERECKAFEDDVVMNLSRLKRPALGIGFGGYCPWHIEYGQSRNPSVHKIIGMIIVSYDLRQDDDGYDLTLSVDAQRGMRHFIELTLKNETDEAGDELEVFDKKQQAGGKGLHRDEGSKSPAERMNKTVKIAGFGSYKFGQKYSATRMTAEMWQEGGLAIKPVQIRYRKFKTLELGYAIDGKQLCRLKLCAEFSPDADNKQLSDELMDVKGELERQLGFEMTGSNNEVIYEDEKYAVKLWYQPTTKTVYKTKHVGFRNQRITNTVNIKGLYLLLEDKRLMPK